MTGHRGWTTEGSATPDCRDVLLPGFEANSVIESLQTVTGSVPGRLAHERADELISTRSTGEGLGRGRLILTRRPVAS